jgi:thiamine-phosphate pyrophosphorylase
MPKLYAIAPTLERARFFLEAGAPVVQLRMKEQPLAPHEAEVRGWVGRFPGSRIIINDDLDFAQRVGAWGVHLGQEDVLRYGRERIRACGLHVGISTHSDKEIAIAKAYAPAMLGFGPIFATATKVVGHAPQGVARLAQVVRTAGLPIIAIGGITGENLSAVAETGCAYIAMIAYLDRFTERQALTAFIDQVARLGRPATATAMRRE